jgi:hypothetical protein
LYQWGSKLILICSNDSTTVIGFVPVVNGGESLPEEDGDEADADDAADHAQQDPDQVGLRRTHHSTLLLNQFILKNCLSGISS